MKAFFAIYYPSRNRPAKYGEFVWNYDQNCYVWAGKGAIGTGRFFDLDTEHKEFQAAADKVLAMDTFPAATVRFIPNAPVPAAKPSDLMAVPIEQFEQAVRERSRELKVLQLKRARDLKAAKHAPKSAPPREEPEIERLEGEGGIVQEPALAS